MSHPSDETLYAAARGDDLPEVLAHTGRCSACASRLRRLQGGAVAMREAKRSMPDLNWNRLDDIIAREAVVAARDIRVAPPVTRGGWLRPLSAGLRRGRRRGRRGGGDAPRARGLDPGRAADSRGESGSRAPSRGRRHRAAQHRGLDPSLHRERPGHGSLQRDPHEGARLETAPGARAVLALQPGVTLDLRAERRLCLADARG